MTHSSTFYAAKHTPASASSGILQRKCGCGRQRSQEKDMRVDGVLLGVVATGHGARAHVGHVLALVAAVRGSFVSGFRGIVPSRMVIAMNWASVSDAAAVGYCHQGSRGHGRVTEQQRQQAHARFDLLRKGAFAFDEQIHLGAGKFHDTPFSGLHRKSETLEWTESRKRRRD